nr:alpha/beta hydrolase [Mesorhizobium sp. L2C054A000]
MNERWKTVLVLAFALAAAGCAGPNTHDLLNKTTVSVPASDIAGTHEIFVATTRKQATKDPRQVFDGDRSLTTSYARVDVTVPKVHQVGAIERAKGSANSNPAKQFTATDVVHYGDASQFAKAVGANITMNGDRALVFVHGFNNGFDDGVYRLTQIAHDTEYPGTPILFSWASSGKTTGYIYDKDSANAARDDLEATLRMLAKTKVKSIDIIAHSMGTWVTMEALRQLAITGDRDLDGKLGRVVLASPDIDVDVFKKQMIRYGKPDRPFVILLSADDRALRLSSLLSGDKPRRRLRQRRRHCQLRRRCGRPQPDQGRRPPEPRQIRRQPVPGAIARRPSARSSRPGIGRTHAGPDRQSRPRPRQGSRIRRRDHHHHAIQGADHRHRRMRAKHRG